VLSNHDVTRPVTRYGRADSGFAFAAKRAGTPTDPALGTRRARAAALLTAALPGSLYLYQGDELGLPEHEQLDDDLRTDPMFLRSGGVDPGRDGCRVPLPWSGGAPPFGFTAAGQPTWLPQPVEWSALTVEAQAADPASMLSLYREALRIRRAELPGRPMRWLPSAPGVLAFTRGDAFACVVNLGPDPVPLPPGELLLASGEPTGGRLPTDTAAWLRTPSAPDNRHPGEERR
jgi:alpha-glucosidase